MVGKKHCLFSVTVSSSLYFDAEIGYKFYYHFFRSIAASTENVKEIHAELQSLKQNVEDFRIELPAELQTLVRWVQSFLQNYRL